MYIQHHGVDTAKWMAEECAKKKSEMADLFGKAELKKALVALFAYVSDLENIRTDLNTALPRYFPKDTGFAEDTRPIWERGPTCAK